MASRASAPGEALVGLVAGTRYDELPKSALEAARLAVLDWWGVTVAGADEPVARILGDALGEAPGPAAILGTPRTAAPLTATLLNGTAAHALDYDDVTLALPGHLTAPILPGLVALAELRGLGGRDLLAAFVLGVEVAARAGRALAPGHYRAGWHATTTLGRLGGAAAAARLLGLDGGRLDTAIGLAAAQAAGVQEAFGSMAKPFQVGRAAADALLSALAAEGGLTGPRGILDTDAWARRLSPTWSPGRLAEGLGRDWAVTDLIFKRYPCCFGTHAAISGLLAARAGLDVAAVTGIELEVGPTTLQVADLRAPETGLAGKFSMTYCGATAVARGHVREDDFADAAVRDPAVQRLATRVTLVPNPSFDETRARVTIRLADGRDRERSVDLAADRDPEGTRRDLTEKFRRLVAPRQGAAEADRLVEAIGSLEAVDRVTELTRRR
ncbi:MAG TPA: MmgE/PrpD family protein [Methylomirabilota bacterium]|jgi:2-methylcitrate dehydratase PrpD|nr:MmgE/PrpD family protein [Methylomirabilota bacterium]